MSIEQLAEQWADKAHEETNHKYGGMPYSFHLAMVVGYARRFIHLIEEPSQVPTILAACWAHDTIEDCRKTYNDVKEALGWTVADLVYALTNEKGKNRKERANNKYYNGIRKTPYATFIKLCDRLANVQYSVNNNQNMLGMYRVEHDEFYAQLYDKQYKEMFEELDRLLQSNKDHAV